MVLKDLWEQQRLERLKSIAELQTEVAQWKQQTQAELYLMQQELDTQAKELHQELKTFANQRRDRSKQEQEQRQQERFERYLELRTDLDSYSQNLYTNSRQERQQRQQEIVKREQEFLHFKQERAKRQEQYRSELKSTSLELSQKLPSFRTRLRNSVWGESDRALEVISNYSKEQQVEIQISTDVSKETKASVLSFTKEDDIKSRVYKYVKETKGVSLIEIEQNMQLSRTQTIDTLRALIKEQLLEQRNRKYFARH